MTDGLRPRARFGRAIRRGSVKAGKRIDAMFAANGPGFRRLAESHAGSVVGDTLVALALAGTLFFSVPSTDARANMFLYLALTVAPFALLGPVLGSVFERFPRAYRSGLVVSSWVRAVVAALMVVAVDTVVLYPLAFALLVLSRLHGISRSSVTPVVLDRPVELVSANARMARIGVLAGVVIAPFGSAAVAWIAPWSGLVLAAVAYVAAGIAATGLPPVQFALAGSGAQPPTKHRLDHSLRLAQFATGGVRFLNGFLLLLVAFAFRDADAGILDFGVILGVGALGFFLSAAVSPGLERRVAEEPMVVAALAVEAGAAFIAAQVFGLWAAAALAGAAGFAWGTAKFGFDGLLQVTVPPEHRGRAFTRSETLFQILWVIGSAIPVAITIGAEIGLVLAGLTALVIQVLYMSALLLPIAEERRRRLEPAPTSRTGTDVTDYIG